MALRSLELILPASKVEEIQSALEGQAVLDRWVHRLEDDLAMVKLLLDAEAVEPILDLLEGRFAKAEGFRVVLLPVEATLPRPVPPEAAESGSSGAETGDAETARKPKGSPSRISREELYNDIEDTIRLSGVFVLMVVLSSIVAALGLLKDSLAVIIGAMVIAPLLGPNIGLSLAATLADLSLGLRALKANAVGLLAPVVLAVALSRVVDVDPTIPEIASRTQVGLGDLALALASGSAGALAFTSGVSAVLVGVMVAVALLPPLVTLGLLWGAGYSEPAFGALLLLVTNLICVNLAGVVTFFAQGVRPATWWEADRAKKSTAIAVALWAILFLGLAFTVHLSQR